MSASQQNRHKRTRYFWLSIAKKERAHAEENMNKKKQEGDHYGVNVYKCRMKALDIYIKTLENQLHNVA